MVLIFNPQLTDLCWERHLDATLQDVVSGDLHRAGQLQVLHHQIGGHLREHLLDLMGLMNRGYIKSEERNGLEKNYWRRAEHIQWKLKLELFVGF